MRIVRSAIALRVGLPLDALRWWAARADGAKSPRELQIESVPPGLRLSANVNLMGNLVRAAGTVYVEGVRLNAEHMRIELRLADVLLKLLQEAPDSPVATLLKSGALDLSKPGNLAAFMPRRPAMLVEAEADRLVLDLAKHPRVESSRQLQKLLAVLTPVLTVSGVETEQDHLDVLLRSFPDGFTKGVEAVRRAL